MRIFSHGPMGKGTRLVLVALVGIIFPAFAWGALPSACTCLTADGTANSSCNASTAAVQCIYDRDTGSQVPLSLSSLRVNINNTLSQNGAGKEINFTDSPVVVESWGAKGAKGVDAYVFGVKVHDGGSGGSRGYARTTVLYDDLDFLAINNSLYLYLGVKPDDSGKSGYGGKGGASSIVIGQPLTNIKAASRPDLERALAIGGGGGGGGAANDGNGRSGGRGGCAVALLPGSSINIPDCTIATEEDASAPGANGSGSGSNWGLGGNRDGQGAGASGQNTISSGADGIGGFGGPRDDNNNDRAGFLAGGLSYNQWTAGSGGGIANKRGSFWFGGGGGGGFGGGGGGAWIDVNTAGVGSGGGGGGAWALLATEDESGIPFVGKDNVGGRGDQGVAALTFGLAQDSVSATAPFVQRLLPVEHKGAAQGVGEAEGHLRLTASFLLEDGLPALQNAKVRILNLLDEHGNDLVAQPVLPIGLPFSRRTRDGAIFKLRQQGQPRVTLALKAVDRFAPIILDDPLAARLTRRPDPRYAYVKWSLLTMALKVNRTGISLPAACGDRNAVPLVMRVLVEPEDTVAAPLLLEVATQWYCNDSSTLTMRALPE